MRARLAAPVALACLTACASSPAQQNTADLAARARDIQSRVISIDTHVDISPNMGLPEDNTCLPTQHKVDLPKMRVRVSDRAVDLTPTEFQLLATLVREPGRVFTRSQLLDALHGVTVDTYERAIDAHVKNLRRKIEPEPGSPRYVVTVHGVGYRFADA